MCVNGEISMDREDINNLFEQVKHEARELDIPVPENIIEEVFINKRPKKRFGCCHYKDGKFLIEISEFILKCSEDIVRGVLAHELLHTCKNCRDHGSTWKKYAGMMNEAYGYSIKRVSSFRDMGIDKQKETYEDRIKYIIKCNKCGKEYHRQRFTCVMKKINAYRCQCGGELSINIHNKATPH